MSTWRIVGDHLEEVTDTLIYNVHDRFSCVTPCVIHAPSGHEMQQWPLIWRDDRMLFERLCGHGIGHPDPDQRPLWRRRVQEGYWDREDAAAMEVHGCDGCCVPTRKGNSNA